VKINFYSFISKVLILSKMHWILFRPTSIVSDILYYLDQELFLYCYLSCSSCWGNLFKKPKTPSFQMIWMKF